MENLTIRNTSKILLFNVFFQIVITVAYFLLSFFVIFPISAFPFSEIISGIILNICNILILVAMIAAKIFVLDIYGCYIKHNKKSQLVIPLIINLIIFVLCQLLVLISGKSDAYFYLFLGINPIATYYSEMICIELGFKEEFHISFMLSMIIVENIVYLLVLYCSAKKKRESEETKEFEKVYYTDDNIVITIKYVENLAYIIAEKIFTDEVIVKETLDTDGVKITDFDVQVSDNKILVKYAKGNDCKEIVEEFIMKE